MPLIVGYEKCKPEKDSIGPLVKTHYILHYVLRGKGYLVIDDRKYNIEANNFFILPPNHMISYRPEKSDPWEYIWIEFEGIGCKQLCESTVLTVDSPVYFTKNEQIITMLCDMIEENNLNFANELSNISHIFNLFSLITKERKAMVEKSTYSKLQKRLRPIVDYIEANYCSPDISVDSISKEFFINSSYFSRVFKEVMGVPPMKYIINLRMRKACTMLNSGTFNIKEVALATGYESPFYFSKEFKRLFGVSPSHFIDAQRIDVNK